MKQKSTESNAIVFEGNAGVEVNTRITGQFKLKLKSVAVATSLGFAALFAASLP